MTSSLDERAPDQPATGTVKAPGARLFYRVRGSGPWLLLLGGGASDADGLDRIAACLVAGYTVITHDRQRLSRSLLDDPGQPPAITIATHSEDVHRVLTALLIRHPEDVRVLVAHEPPVGGLLTADEEPPVSLRDVYAETATPTPRCGSSPPASRRKACAAWLRTARSAGRKPGITNSSSATTGRPCIGTSWISTRCER